MKKFLTSLVVLAFLLSGSQAFALASGYSSAVSPNATGFGVKFASDGTPTATMGQAGTGVTVASSSIGLPLAGTMAPAVISASSLLLGSAIAGPWGVAATAVGVVAMFAIPAFQDAYSAAKMRVNPATGAVEKADPNACTSGTCYNWRLYNEIPNGTLYSTQLGACQAYLAKYPVPDYQLIGVWNTNQCIVHSISQNTTYYPGFLARYVVAPAPATWIPSSVAEVQAAITTQAPTIAEVQALIDLNFPPAVPAPALSGAANFPKFNSVKALPTGGTQTDACRYDLIYVGDHVNVSESCVATVVTPGATTTSTTTTKDANGNVISTATSTATVPSTVASAATSGSYNPQVAADAAAAPKPVQCGLSPLPACAVKVDETGMPVATDISAQPVIDTYKPIKDFVNDPTTLGKPLPTINWSFSLPSGCSVIPVTGAFHDFIDSIDVCQFQPIFHNIMSMVWMLGGLFGAISLFMKSSLSE